MAPSRELWFTAPRQVQIVAGELPPLADGEALVRSLFSGISAGTELLAYRGQLPSDLVVDETISGLAGTFDYPFRYGYSCVGVVEQSRAAFAEGDVVFAFQPHQDRFVAAAADLVRVAGLEPRLATLFPLVETGLQISLEAAPLSGPVAVVFGLGAVGAITSWLLARSGVEVIAVDPLLQRRHAAQAAGVTAVPPDDLAGILGSHGVDGGVDLVVEASGNPDVLRTALSALNHEGTVLVASWYGAKQVTLPLGGDFHRRRLTIRSTQVSTIPRALSGEWSVARRRVAAAELLTELPLDRLATHTFDFDDADQAFAALDQDTGVIHAALGYR